MSWKYEFRKKSITKQKIRLTAYDISRLHHGYYQSTKSVVGKIAKRNIRIGVPINPKLVRAPTLVKRGEAVNIIAGEGGVQVSMPGIALKNGILGELVRVRNSDSKRIIEAVIMGPGKVVVR